MNPGDAVWIDFPGVVQTKRRPAVELLAIPGFERSFVRGINDIKSDRVTPWRQVRNNV